MKTAVYPGSFDPITNGHLDIIGRAQDLFDKLIILVAKSHEKKPLFSIEERVEMAKAAVEKYGDRVEVAQWGGLTTDYAREKKISCIVRGVRSSVDFRLEQTLANLNYELFPECETLLLCCRAEYRDVSSRVVKEIALHGGPIAKFVPSSVETALTQKLKNQKESSG
jgi:pantetheine-phosphate adenylyltransferase